LTRKEPRHLGSPIWGFHKSAISHSFTGGRISPMRLRRQASRASDVTNLQFRITYIERSPNSTAYNNRSEENLSARSKPSMHQYTHNANAVPQRTGFGQ
jgi:hypothetical protein